LLSYLSLKNPWLLLLSIVFFISTGEEISWGQRIIGFSTPDNLNEINVQQEFTLHNIEVFNAHGFDDNEKTGFKKLLTINFLYKLFWLGYCILLPIASLTIKQILNLSNKIKLPIPPLTIGIFFLINWVMFRIILSFILPDNESIQYYDTIGEIRECCSAFIFFILSFYFFNNRLLKKVNKIQD